MRLIKTPALVLKKKYLPEKNFILTLFSQKLGKINIFGFGIKKITSRRLPALQTGNLIQALIEKRGGNFSLKEVKLISAFSGIKKDFEKTKYLYLILFILDRLLPENQNEEKIYQLTVIFLTRIAKKKPANNDLINFINTILKQLGYINLSLPKIQLFHFVEELIKEKIPSFIRV